MLFRTINLKKAAAFVFAAFLLFAAVLIPYYSYSVQTAGTEFIKWVDFNVTAKAMQKAMEYDINSHGSGCELDWISLLAYLGATYGGDFSHYKAADMEKLAARLTAGEKMADITKDMKYYDYYYEAYLAVLGGFLGEFEIAEKNDSGDVVFTKKYGLKAFSPIAGGYYYNDYDDFGKARTYGFKREHLGHDLMGSVGTPVVAVESGVVEAVGWNQYGGWRIGIRSMDKKRYYYYAHLRKDHPYNDIYEGKVVTAGDVIGYLGMTGYSTKENVNNINTPHLHYGLQLIFDESQKDSNNEIWVDLYEITKFLEQNKSAVRRCEGSKDFERQFVMYEPGLPD